MHPEDIEKLVIAAKAGGGVVRNYFGQVLDVEEKSRASDCRTKADTESEAAILGHIKQDFPDFGIYAEESGKIDNNSPYTIIIDPLDGSHNFVIGVPNFSVSIAVVTKTDLIAGVVYHPITDQVYTAFRGEGAYLNGNRLQVSAETRLEQSTISFANNYATAIDRIYRFLKAMEDKQVKRILRNWSIAYDFCLLADGKIEIIANDETDFYDYAAGKLIAKEAGAIISQFNGQAEERETSDRFIVCATQELHRLVVETLREANYE